MSPNRFKTFCFASLIILVPCTIALLAFWKYSYLTNVSHSLFFNLVYFEPDATGILYDGDAKSSSGVIKLNRNIFADSGRATYSEPLHLWDSASGTMADFTTHFTFSIDIVNVNHTGDGLVFFLAPLGYQIPPNSAGSYFGLVNETTRFHNQVVMVEFDTFSNLIPEIFWDPPEQHVGINVNSISSVNNTKWDANSHGGEVADVFISYNSTTKNLSVSWKYKDEKAISSLSHIVDLKQVLPEWVTFGFSASTGLFFEVHNIKSWEFSSSLDYKVKRLRPHVIALAAFFLVLLLGVAVFRFVIRKRNANGREHISLTYTDLEREALPKRFSHLELVAATDGFANSRKLGQGGSGQVYRGTLTGLGRLVAVKRIAAGPDHSQRIFTNEVKIISRLIHRNLVQFIGWCHEQDEFLLVYEYMSNGSLDTHLFGNKRTLPWNVRYKIALGLASAMHYLHEDAEHCVLHRDIKSANILLDTDFSTKLGDFGVAKLVDPRMRTQMTGVVGTYGYLAPEYVNRGRASKESDMFSFGVVALEIACGRRTYQQGEYHVPLMRWVWELYLSGNIMDAADERLNMEFDPDEMKRLMIVGLWSTNPSDKERPNVGQVIKLLQLEIPIPELPHDMHDPVVYSLLYQQKIDSFQPPVTSSVNNVGR